MIFYFFLIVLIGIKINRLRLREDRRILLVRLVRYDYKNLKGF